jgi:hypothetical protein
LPYLWKRIHCPTVEMASWVSFNDESFARRLSSVKAMLQGWWRYHDWTKALRSGRLSREQCKVTPLSEHSKSVAAPSAVSVSALRVCLRFLATGLVDDVKLRNDEKELNTRACDALTKSSPGETWLRRLGISCHRRRPAVATGRRLSTINCRLFNSCLYLLFHISYTSHKMADRFPSLDEIDAGKFGY